MSTTGILGGLQDLEHTLVIVFLRGGADGLNMVVPVEDDAYYRARSTLSISKKKTVRLPVIE